MNFVNGLGAGWGQSGGNRGLRAIEPVCKPGPNFESCSRDQLIGTGGAVFALALCLPISICRLVCHDRLIVCPWRQDSFAAFLKAVLTRSHFFCFSKFVL